MPRSRLLIPALILAILALGWVAWFTLREDGAGPGSEPGREPGTDSTTGAPVPLPDPPPDGPQDPPEGPDVPNAEGTFSARGRVLDSERAPAAGVGVGVVREWDGGSTLYRMPLTRTDPDGRFEVAGIPVAGARLVFFPSIPERISETAVLERPACLSPDLEGRPGEVLELGDFYLEPAGKITGMVIDEAGVAVPGARVVAGLMIGGLSKLGTLSDAEGRFEVEGLLPGEYFVHASIQTDSGAFRFRRRDGMHPGDTGVELRLQSGSALLLRFRSSAAPDRPFLLRSGTLHRGGTGMAISFGGRATAEPISEWRVSLSPGLHRLRLTCKGFQPVILGEVSIQADRETVIEVKLLAE